MMRKTGRRGFLRSAGVALGGAGSLGALVDSNLRHADASFEPGRFRADGENRPSFKLGLVTYELAKDWDIETIIKNSETTGFDAVELRTTHNHGVEPSTPKERRVEVKKRFADSPVRLMSLGTTCEYHSPDPAVVERNIEETRRFAELARDIGALGVKVRPNGFPPGVPEEKTLERIGRALARTGDAARDLGVEIWLEVHGEGTQLPPNIRRIMEVSNHPAVGVCWNSNDPDVVEGSVKPSFDLLKPWLKSCHINELWRNPSPWDGPTGRPPDEKNPGFPAYGKPYPYRELFALLRAAGYDRYTFAEVPASCDPIRFMRYYRALWEQLTS